MRDELTVRIAGSSGTEEASAGIMLCRLFRNRGSHVFAFGNRSAAPRDDRYFQVRTAGRPVYASRDKADIVLALDRRAAEINAGVLAPDGLLLLDAECEGRPAAAGGPVVIPLRRLAREAGLPDRADSAILGALAAVCGDGAGSLLQVIEREFAGKDPAAAGRNKLAASKAFEYAGAKIAARFPVAAGPLHDSSCLLSGNEALALGFYAAGCRRYAACGPCAPGSEGTPAYYALKYGMKAEPGEVPPRPAAPGAKSGKGFSLYLEGLAFAGREGTPVRIVRLHGGASDALRTEDCDIYAPGSPEEAFRIAKRAFARAERFGTPAVILSDPGPGASYLNIKQPDLSADALGTSDNNALAAGAVPGTPLPPAAANPGAGTMLCGFGPTLGLLKELCASREDTGFVHFSQLRPFPAGAARNALRGAGCVLVIGDDPSALLAELLARETAVQADGTIVKYNGGAFTLDEAVRALENSDPRAGALCPAG